MTLVVGVWLWAALFALSAAATDDDSIDLSVLQRYAGVDGDPATALAGSNHFGFGRQDYGRLLVQSSFQGSNGRAQLGDARFR